MVARVDMLAGKKLTFDEESKALYDAVAPTSRRGALPGDRSTGSRRPCPGDGAAGRAHRGLPAGLRHPAREARRGLPAAIAECRRRTLAHIELPAGESFTVEYVTDKPWSGYNWYKGGFHSLIQVNTDLPIFIDRAIDLACHEGYPGHHVYNALLEKHLVRDRGWVRVLGLPAVLPAVADRRGDAPTTASRSPSRARSGSPSSARSSSRWPGSIRLDGRRATTRSSELVQRARPTPATRRRAAISTARSTPTQAADWLVRYALMSPERAEQRVRFFDSTGATSSTTTSARTWCAQYVEAPGRHRRPARAALGGVRRAALLAAAAVGAER